MFDFDFASFVECKSLEKFFTTILLSFFKAFYNLMSQRIMDKYDE